MHRRSESPHHDSPCAETGRPHLSRGHGWRQFDSLASRYNRWYETPLGAFVDRTERQAVFELLEATSGELILDIGAGTGRYARELLRQGVRCVALEPSQGMLTVALESDSEPAPDYVRAVAEQLPLAPAMFDAVICVTTLEFVSDIDAVVSEAARVSKPGGRLVVGVLNERGSWAAARRRSGDPLWKTAHFLGEAEIETLLQRYGMVTLRRAVYVPPRARSIPQGIFPLIEWIGARTKLSAPAFIAARLDVRR